MSELHEIGSKVAWRVADSLYRWQLCSREIQQSERLWLCCNVVGEGLIWKIRPEILRAHLWPFSSIVRPSADACVQRDGRDTLKRIDVYLNARVHHLAGLVRSLELPTKTLPNQKLGVPIYATADGILYAYRPHKGRYGIETAWIDDPILPEQKDQIATWTQDTDDQLF